MIPLFLKYYTAKDEYLLPLNDMKAAVCQETLIFAHFFVRWRFDVIQIVVLTQKFVLVCAIVMVSQQFRRADLWQGIQEISRRCFEIFPDNPPLDEIAESFGIKIETVRRYHRQWKDNPNFEKQYAYLKKLLNKTSPDRERTKELCSNACGITKEEFETVLSQPHGLRRLMTGKFYFPGHAATDRKLYLTLEVAMTISDHLDYNRGMLEDVLYAFKRWMKEYQAYREEHYTEIINSFVVNHKKRNMIMGG